jgi:hypothetical protein
LPAAKPHPLHCLRSTAFIDPLRGMGGVSLPFFRLRRKPAARATAFHEHFFAFGKTVLAPLPALHIVN